MIHTEAETFSTRHAAAAWIEKRESALVKPGGLENAVSARKGASPHPQGGDRQVPRETEREPGRTKDQVLRTAKTLDIADLPCDPTTKQVLVAYGKELAAGPGRRRSARPSRT